MEDEFVFREPPRAHGWTPKAKELEYQRQYEEWKKEQEQKIDTENPL